ncbi:MULTISPECIES: ABC transporter ATP-binding protein [Citromicrobium]|uniref:ABC transporter ATP-binding protein n=1 Tax=Citromicrobium TaxID=72173 RepID=UPI0006C8FCDC|nr:ABC transporter ATP-binding protein [Citromicrobium bathyomarinum]KPM15047.1 phosphonate ABC transporter ATP-binding protein [Citromicrobium sp. WPS32]KPM22607.1 phosphonate ABC transporter ATP-binding protein [Citromicrobium sp. RCC1885]KPM26090.1 phosphonate ABC transporter ATP-binding protein [Citromicrobium sp. RCC1878]MAO03781.1 ABC transporter ATP-binding protein [Citromicrobium sp.]OAM07817.1 phosphonate ABC transporter ATP-binding protein [Citromicrobium sp. RCC1897]|tara:strand:- start:295 stop:984 length:690 start_codon:yes stop_codon:yes gene_type:complete
MNFVIKLENIERRYASDEVETTALVDVNLEVAEGEFLAIMGPSGCGKSTLLNTLGTIDRPTSGHYWFGEEDLAAMDEKALAKFRAAQLGFVFQSFNLIDELTIEENIALGLAYRKDVSGNKAERVAAAMDTVGIAHRARHFPHQLSGGQQQRAAIARAIVGQPKLILADEPTGNLDTANGEQVMDILTALNAGGATIVMVTHSPSHADMAKRRIDMLDGRIVASAMRAI